MLVKEGVWDYGKGTEVGKFVISELLYICAFLCKNYLYDRCLRKSINK
jgi:hypothetical protein